jgi:hypothetical protein
MKIIGLLQNRNNVDNGYLRWCLTSMSRIADAIVVYDDASDQNVHPLYEQFECDVIYGETQEFHRELFHKQQMLDKGLTYDPDWFVWFDADAVLGAFWASRERTEKALNEAADKGIVVMLLHNLNLWRSWWWYRSDQSFNELWHCVFWKNTGQLNYDPQEGLHLSQYPYFWNDREETVVASRFEEELGQLIHFGFATDEEIARKYFTYRGKGQEGWPLERMVAEGKMLNEQTEEEEEFSLHPADPIWYPDWLTPQLGSNWQPPAPRFTPEKMAAFGNYGEWDQSRRRTT